MIHPYEPPLSDAEIEARDPLVLWQQRKPLAEKLCADLRGAGVSYCEVQRARSTR